MGQRGPKPRTPSELKSAATGVRLTEGLRQRLQKSANQNGVSLSQEISARLEESFSESRRRVEDLGGLWTYNLFRLFAKALAHLHRETGRAWHRDAYSFRHAVAAINEILEYFRPDGIVKVPDDHPALESLRSAGVTDLKPIIAQLAKFEHGRQVGKLTVFQMEVSGFHPDSEYYKPFREIAERLSPRLKQLKKSGKAQRDLLALVKGNSEVRGKARDVREKEQKITRRR